MATAAAATLLALLSPQSTTTTGAFVPPRSVASLPLRSPAQMSRVPDDGEASPLARASPVRTGEHGPLARLTRREEVSLLRQMRGHPARSSVRQAARQTLLLHNLPLVQSVVTSILGTRPGVRRKPGAALTRDDLLHEGTIGLAEAIDRYDLSYAREDDGDGDASPGGARLGTYATYWIRARVLRAIQSREHALRVPERALQASHRLVRAAGEMGLEWDAVGELADRDVASASREELREKLKERARIGSDGLLRDAMRARSMSGPTTPLESWMSPSSSAAAALNGEGSEQMLSSGGQEHILETLSKFLVPREVEVLSLRYGLASAGDEEEEKQEEGRVLRDYQAEAEEDLFGPKGILSHYSATPNEDGIAVAAGTPPGRADGKRARAAPSLLPFKEIGKRMKFSGEYCRRTCTEALNKLNRAAEEGKLAESDFLLGW